MAKFIMAQYKDNLLGEANSFLEVLEQVSRLAPLDKPVLVTEVFLPGVAELP